MKKGFFNDKIIFTGVFSAIGFLFCLTHCEMVANSPLGCILWSVEVVAVTLIMGYIGLELSFWIKRKKYKVIGKRNTAISLVLALVLALVIGTFGQTLYALELKTEDNVFIEEETNAVFLLDWSLSMNYQRLSCMQAISDSLEKMNEDVYFQYVPFSSYDIDRQNHATELLPVSNSNRELLKSKIQKNWIDICANNFDMALDFAVETITNTQYESRRNIIVLFSDCVGDADTSISSVLSNYGIEFYIMFIKNSEAFSAGPSGTPLLSVADETFSVDCGTLGIEGADVDDCTDAISKILIGENNDDKTIKKLMITSDMIFKSGEVNFWKVLVRVLFFGMFTLAASYLYYGFENKMKILVNFVFGAVAALLTCINYPFGICLLLFVGVGGFTKIETEGNMENV